MRLYNQEDVDSSITKMIICFVALISLVLFSMVIYIVHVNSKNNFEKFEKEKQLTFSELTVRSERQKKDNIKHGLSTSNLEIYKTAFQLPEDVDLNTCKLFYRGSFGVVPLWKVSCDLFYFTQNDSLQVTVCRKKPRESTRKAEKEKQ